MNPLDNFSEGFFQLSFAVSNIFENEKWEKVKYSKDHGRVKIV